jgi:phosphoglycerol transferase MdoB-like AlkP superfamily enzyme
MRSDKFNSIYFPFYLFIFFITGLTIWRLLFIYYNDVPDVFRPIKAGLLLDTSMICGSFLAGYVPWIIFLFTGFELFRHLCKWIYIFIWASVCIIEFGSIIIYKEWGATLDGRAISYLNHPTEAWASSKDFLPFWTTCFGLIILISGIKKITSVFGNWNRIYQRKIQTLIFVLIIGPVSFVGLRGGLQKLPIVPSDAFYSSDMKNNFAATNKVWYLLYSLVKSTKFTLSNNEKDIIQFEDQYQSAKASCTVENLSLTGKNIVMLVAEGWSADMVKYLGGKEVVTPFFDSLCIQSLCFTNAFSTGFRTDQGLTSLLSGIPSIQSLNMPNVLTKVAAYPSLPSLLKKNGRETSFIYGGDLNFSNLYNYVRVMDFDTIISEKDFTSSERLTDWGVPDHIMVQKALNVIDSHRGLFFSTILLLSSHSPFDVPVANKFSGKSDIPSKYKSSVKYSDMSLSLFFMGAKKRDWYKNTVFIITSDHGSTHSGAAGMEDHQRFRIPLIFFFPDSIYNVYDAALQIPCNHFDLPYTIALSAGLDTHNFTFGRNMFCNDKRRVSYWNIEETAGSFGVETNNIEPIKYKTGTKSGNGVLFLDMVKKWYESLH